MTFKSSPSRNEAMKKLILTCSVYVWFIPVLLFFLSGCVTTSHDYSEEGVARDLQSIHERLGATHDDLWREISNSSDYTREQAVDLKRRVGELVVAYEELSVKAGCMEHRFPSCSELFTAGLRFNITILDAEHPDLPPLPPIVEGYRLH